MADSFYSAILLVLDFDRELLGIMALSLKISCISTLFAGLFGIPLAFPIALHSFRGRQFLITFLNTLLALPTVVIGLFVYALVSRKGILGPLNLLYTQKAIIIGQIILILPVIIAFTISALTKFGERYAKTAMTLGANRMQTAAAIFHEARFGIVTAIVAAFGRVISEIGISMMLGGNIRGFTRTMTTAMALEYDKGEFSLAVALGLILLFISFAINMLFHFFKGRSDS